MLKLVKDDESRPDPAEFRIPASDTKGHSARQWFRCIPAMARQIEQVIQARQFPYRTKGDILRHALHRHMKWLNELDPFPTVSGQVDAMLELMRDEEMNKDFTLVFSKLEDRIKCYLNEGEEQESARLVLTIQSYIRDMPDGFWKEKYKKKIETQYGRLIGKVKKADFGRME